MASVGSAGGGRAPRPPREIVRHARPPPKHRLEDKQVYAKLGRSALLHASPTVVHFGGFRLHQRHEQRVRVVNRSPVSQRIHVLPPSTPHFTLQMDKRGVIAPGMAQDMRIVFTPTDFRYYFDSVRVHCESENLLIPLHAYPVMNKAAFPSRVDLGRVSVGDVASATIPLTCNVPIEFEFQVDVTKPHPAFRVHPLSGVVPADR